MDDQATEIWLDVPGLPCAASSFGRIRRFAWATKPTYGTKSAKGYMVVQVCGDQYRVNRLVCMAFHGSAPSAAHQAAHDDGIKVNNVPTNLSWKTPQENTEDKIRHGTVPARANHGRALLTEQDVSDIRTRKQLGHRISHIALDYPHVSPSTVWHAALGRNWK